MMTHCCKIVFGLEARFFLAVFFLLFKPGLQQFILSSRNTKKKLPESHFTEICQVASNIYVVTFYKKNFYPLMSID